MRLLCLLATVLIITACSKPPAAAAAAAADAATSTAAEQQAADEASLLKVAREAGVSDADALKEKAKLDKVYDDTAAEMSQAERERNARDAAFKDEACVADCK